MGNEERVSGKVAKILNSREIVINKGSNHGVEEGMYFKVLEPKGEDIKDPDTGETLGSVNRPKVQVKVKEVKEKLSVAMTYKKKKVNVGGSGLNVGKLGEALAPPVWKEEYETLKAEEKAWDNLDEEESVVKIGDPVVELSEEEVKEVQEREK